MIFQHFSFIFGQCAVCSVAFSLVPKRQQNVTKTGVNGQLVLFLHTKNDVYIQAEKIFDSSHKIQWPHSVPMFDGSM